MFGWLGVFSFIQLSYWGRIEAKYVRQKSIGPTSSMAWPEFCCRSSSWIKSCAIVKRACHAFSTHSIKYKRNVHKIDIKHQIRVNRILAGLCRTKKQEGTFYYYNTFQWRDERRQARRRVNGWMIDLSLLHFLHQGWIQNRSRLRQWRGEATQARHSIHWFLP